MRIGQGFDAHRFKAGRPLILGGVKIPSELGLEGHSDADAVTHAVCDALLGALAKGDIGTHFPDTDDRYKDISSLILLGEVARIMEQDRFKLVNMDITVIAERPLISPFAARMLHSIAGTLGVGADKICVKATTTEGMGFCGRGEGIAALCICLLTEL